MLRAIGLSQVILSCCSASPSESLSLAATDGLDSCKVSVCRLITSLVKSSPLVACSFLLLLDFHYLLKYVLHPVIGCFYRQLLRLGHRQSSSHADLCPHRRRCPPHHHHRRPSSHRLRCWWHSCWLHCGWSDVDVGSGRRNAINVVAWTGGAVSEYRNSRAGTWRNHRCRYRRCDRRSRSSEDSARSQKQDHRHAVKAVRYSSSLLELPRLCRAECGGFRSVKICVLRSESDDPANNWSFSRPLIGGRLC